MTSSQLCLYKSAELKINITVSFDPQDGFGHSKIHFGEVFQVQGAKVPKVIGDKRCKDGRVQWWLGCQGLKGAKVT